MQTRREALVKVGLAKPGRGKFSKEAETWLSKARSEGQKFSDDNKSTGIPVVRVVNEKSSGSRVKVSAPIETPYLFPDEYRFPEAEYIAYRREGGKKVPVGLRECCSTCKVSLVNHGCNAPVVYGDVPVFIERKK